MRDFIPPPTQFLSDSLNTSQHAAVFLHVIVNILNEPIDGEIAQALKNHGIKRLTDIKCMSFEDIEKFSLTQEDKVKIHSLHDYLYYCNFDDCEIVSVTNEDYKAFYAKGYDSSFL